MILQIFLMVVSTGGLQAVEQREIQCDGNLGCEWDCRFALIRHPTAEAAFCRTVYRGKEEHSWKFWINPNEKDFYCTYFHIHDCPEDKSPKRN